MANKDSLSVSASLRCVIIRGNINFALDVRKTLSIYLRRLGIISVCLCLSLFYFTNLITDEN